MPAKKGRKIYTEAEIEKVMLASGVSRLEGEEIPSEGTYVTTGMSPRDALQSFESRWGYPAEFWWYQESRPKQYGLGPSGSL